MVLLFRVQTSAHLGSRLPATDIATEFRKWASPMRQAHFGDDLSGPAADGWMCLSSPCVLCPCAEDQAFSLTAELGRLAGVLCSQAVLLQGQHLSVLGFGCNVTSGRWPCCPQGLNSQQFALQLNGCLSTLENSQLENVFRLGEGENELLSFLWLGFCCLPGKGEDGDVQGSCVWYPAGGHCWGGFGAVSFYRHFQRRDTECGSRHTSAGVQGSHLCFWWIIFLCYKLCFIGEPLESSQKMGSMPRSWCLSKG